LYSQLQILISNLKEITKVGKAVFDFVAKDKLKSKDQCETLLQIIWQSDLGILEFHSFPVDSFAPSLPISSEHFAPYPFPPATKVIPSAKVSM
jgi:hypothetical protein